MPEPQEIAVDLTFPIKGLDQSKGYESQPIGTTHNAVNVRNFEALTRRGRGGSRQFLTRYVDDQLPGYIQNLNFVVEHKGEAVLGSVDGFPPFITFGGVGVVTNWIPDPSSTYNTLGEVRNRGGWVPIGGTGVTVIWPKKRPVRIAWENPDDAPDGHALDGFDLDAIAVDARDGNIIQGGTYTYTPAIGYVLRLKNQASTRVPLRVRWVPDFLHSDDYDAKSKTVHVNVIKRDPVITWPDPANMTPEDTLSGTQLNATATDPITSATVAGTFTYTPPSGTVMHQGNNQQLSVSFTPTNDKLYNTETDTAVVDVGTGVAFVQNKYLGNGVFATSTTSNASFDSSVGSGHLLIALVVLEDDKASTGAGNPVTPNPNTTISITDNLGNTWVQAGTYVRQDINNPVGNPTAWPFGETPYYVTAALFYVKSSTAGATTLTITMSTAVGLIGWALAEYSGLDTVTPLIAFNSSSAQGDYATTPTPSATGTVSVEGGDLAVGYSGPFANNSGNPSAGDLTLRGTTSSGALRLFLADNVNSVSGTSSAEWGNNGPLGWVALIASFQSSANV